MLSTFIILFNLAHSSLCNDFQFITDLLKDYDKRMRPVKNEDDVVNMTITPIKLDILSLDEAIGTISFSAEFVVQWKDAFLKFEDHPEYNLTWIKIRESLIWTPDTTIASSVETRYVIGENKRLVNLKNDGTVRQSLYVICKNRCAMETFNFPYDVQRCMIQIGPWSWTAREVWCEPGDLSIVKLENIEGNSEWVVQNLASELNYSMDDDVGFNYTVARFYISLKRRPTFYVWVLIVPTYIFSTIAFCGLFTPTNNCGRREEKVNLGITYLLSSVVILLIVANSMPKTSALPLLGNYILGQIFIVAFAVLCSVVILTLHNRAHIRTWRPPGWVLFVLNSTGSKKFLKKEKEKILSKQSRKEERFQLLLKNDSPLLEEFTDTLRQVHGQLRDCARDRVRELAWEKFFERIDLALFTIFQIGNAIATAIMTKPQ